MKNLKIGFSSPINNPFPIFSYAIKQAYNTKYSHTYLKFRSESIDRDIIYESVGVGVRFIGSTEWENHAEVIEEFQLTVTDEQYIKTMQFCVDHAGKKYGKKQVIGIYIAKLFRMKKNIFKNDDDEQICSEIVGRLLSDLGYVFDKDFDLLTPKDIYTVLKEQKPTV
jgi:uncharacterized protein YycO